MCEAVDLALDTSDHAPLTLLTLADTVNATAFLSRCVGFQALCQYVEDSNGVLGAVRAAPALVLAEAAGVGGDITAASGVPALLKALESAGLFAERLFSSVTADMDFNWEGTLSLPGALPGATGDGEKVAAQRVEMEAKVSSLPAEGRVEIHGVVCTAER